MVFGHIVDMPVKGNGVSNVEPVHMVNEALPLPATADDV